VRTSTALGALNANCSSAWNGCSWSLQDGLALTWRKEGVANLVARDAGEGGSSDRPGPSRARADTTATLRLLTADFPKDVSFSATVTVTVTVATAPDGAPSRRMDATVKKFYSRW